MSDLHQLLPWYMNGTLDEAERASYEAHLGDCQACREEMSVIEALRGELQNPDWDVLADHPSPQSLAEVFLDGKDDTGARRHLAVCLTCAEEARWLKGEAPCGRKSVPAPPPAGRWAGKWAIGAAAVLILAVAVSLVVRLRPAGHPTGLLLVNLVPASERGQVGHRVVEIPAEADVVHLLFEVDLGAEDFPASFRLLDAAGRPVISVGKVEAAALYRGAFLFLACGREDCPDGAYVARLSPKGGRSPDIEYPFSLATRP